MTSKLASLFSWNFPHFRSFAECQRWTISQQLNAGIRFFDIRCRHYNNVCAIHHGPIFFNAFLDNIIIEVDDFLTRNPSEVALLMISNGEHEETGNTRSFADTVKASGMTSKWWQHSHNPTLGEVRGKYILVKRTSALSNLEGLNAGTFVEYNEWNLNDIKEKNRKMQDHIRKARRNTNDGKFYIGYTSIAARMTNGSTLHYASRCNTWLLQWLTRNPKMLSGKYGIVMMDWPGPGLIKRLYEHNFYSIMQIISEFIISCELKP